MIPLALIIVGSIVAIGVGLLLAARRQQRRKPSPPRPPRHAVVKSDADASQRPGPPVPGA